MKMPALFSDDDDDSVAFSAEEESGWTMYFEDFIESNKRGEEEEIEIEIEMEEDGGSNSMSLQKQQIAPAGSCVISDAVSSSACKFPGTAGTSADGTRKKLSFKKRRARGIFDDDPLEDTATSPLNSPKVSNMNVLKFNQMRKAENGDSPLQEKGGDFEKCTEQRRDADTEMDEMGELFENGNECTELKKRGLCLVPMSMLADYL